nr:uncharacterized protein LOC109182044 isoform X2 [Ipomoea trifida]
MILQWLRIIPQQLNPEVDISVQYTEWLVDNGITKPVDYNEIHAPSVGIGSMSMARKPIESSTKIDSSLGFSIVHFVKGPRVKETDQFIAVTTGKRSEAQSVKVIAELNAYRHTNASQITGSDKAVPKKDKEQVKSFSVSLQTLKDCY